MFPHMNTTQWAEERSQSGEPLLLKHVHLNLMCSSQVEAGVGEGALRRETEASLGLAGQCCQSLSSSFSERTCPKD